MWTFEARAVDNGFLNIAGVDEAGRGPLAGPVVSAAVILPADFPVSGVGDSKTLTPKQRDLLFDAIRENAAAFAVGVASVEEIDTLNILQASLLSMKRAVEALTLTPDFLLIDGKFTISSDIAQEAVVKGDSKSISIAAASIVAKVTRDRIMGELHDSYPEYGFNKHKGYPTKAHKDAILKFGASPVHRMTFRGVKDI